MLFPPWNSLRLSSCISGFKEKTFSDVTPVICTGVASLNGQLMVKRYFACCIPCCSSCRAGKKGDNLCLLSGGEFSLLGAWTSCMCLCRSCFGAGWDEDECWCNMDLTGEKNEIVDAQGHAGSFSGASISRRAKFFLQTLLRGGRHWPHAGKANQQPGVQWKPESCHYRGSWLLAILISCLSWNRLFFSASNSSFSQCINNQWPSRTWSCPVQLGDPWSVALVAGGPQSPQVAPCCHAGDVLLLARRLLSRRAEAACEIRRFLWELLSNLQPEGCCSCHCCCDSLRCVIQAFKQVRERAMLGKVWCGVVALPQHERFFGGRRRAPVHEGQHLTCL